MTAGQVYDARADCPRCDRRLVVDRDGDHVGFVCEPCALIVGVEDPATREADRPALGLPDP